MWPGYPCGTYRAVYDVPSGQNCWHVSSCIYTDVIAMHDICDILGMTHNVAHTRPILTRKIHTRMCAVQTLLSRVATANNDMEASGLPVGHAALHDDG